MGDRQPENSYPMNTTLRPGTQAPAEAAIIMPDSLGTVLLVEDEEGIREVTAMLLSHLQYSVICAACGADAIEKFQSYEGTIHVLLTDVVMPGMTGLALAQTLCSMDPELRTIIMSGFSGDDMPHDETFPFLEKPFTREKLAKALRRVLENNVPIRSLH
jgi:two-component system cell cycle sensor histidine kinase/response regulator CckA